MSVSSDLKKLKKIVREVGNRSKSLGFHSIRVGQNQSSEEAIAAYELEKGIKLTSGDLVVLLQSWADEPRADVIDERHKTIQSNIQ
jgi:hypothetical protein